jgi:hypothetical protein
MPNNSRITFAVIPVFYLEKMVANTDSYSPSAAKPKTVVPARQALLHKAGDRDS